MVDVGVGCSVCQGPGLMTVTTFWKPDPTDLRPCSSATALTEHRQARRRGWRLPTGQAEAAQAMSDYAYAALRAGSGFVGGDPQPHSRRQFRRLASGGPNLHIN